LICKDTKKNRIIEDYKGLEKSIKEEGKQQQPIANYLLPLYEFFCTFVSFIART
jgi:hypothetical protein